MERKFIWFFLLAVDRSWLSIHQAPWTSFSIDHSKIRNECKFFIEITRLLRRFRSIRECDRVFSLLVHNPSAASAISLDNQWAVTSGTLFCGRCWCAILIAHQIVMAKYGGSCVHFSGISTCGRTSRETVSHSQRQPLPTPHKIALPVYVTVTNKRLQPLTTTLYNSLVLSFSLLTTKRRLI